MVSSVGSSAAATSPFAAPSKPTSNDDPSLDFSQTVDNYLQDSTSGATATASSSNSTQPLSDDLMSSLMQMQESLGS